MSQSQSADRILSILDLFTEDRLEWTSDEMMIALGYSRPTLYRYLKSLRSMGFLSSLPNAGFTLGPRVVEMDFLMRKSDRLVCLGREHLLAICQKFQCSAQLVRWYNGKLLCVASENSTKNPISSYPRGRPMPLSRGAISKAVMANLPRRQLLPILEANFTELVAIKLGTTIDEMIAQLREIRQAGVAVAFGEVTPNVIGIAAPVFDAGQTPIATLSLTIEENSENTAKLSQFCEIISTKARNLSADLSAMREQIIDDERV